MTIAASGKLSELLLVRLHGRTAEYAVASDSARPGVAATCRREATVGDLAERILSRTIYSQASSRLGPLRELLQNAIDASLRGGRVDVRTVPHGHGDVDEITVTDRGRGMSRAELMDDLLVPFRTGKEGDPEAIGEHGIGFLSALWIAPRLEVVSGTLTTAFRLYVEPIGAGPPYRDFSFTLEALDPRRRTPQGTSVRLLLDRSISSTALAEELFTVAGLVETRVARIFFDGEPVNTVRARMRRVARMPVGEAGAYGALELFTGRGDRVSPRFMITQKGLLVMSEADPFAAPEHALHRDLLRALTSAGYGIVADLPLDVPLTKGRTGPAAAASGAVSSALVAAFERFILEDALYDRELLRGVDHRLAAVLDRLVGAALRGEVSAAPVASAAAASSTEERPSNAPTVAAPETVVRFAGVLVDAPMFVVSYLEPGRGEVRCARSLRDIVDAHRRGVLRAGGHERELHPGILYLGPSDPLAQALFRRLTLPTPALAMPDPSRVSTARPMARVARERLLRAAELPGVRALSAALSILERIDHAVSVAACLAPSVISAHQDLYGPDEMAHTDGTGISVNLASARIRALLCSVLATDDDGAFGALVDLVLHEKAHVALASYVPRSCAEHGASFYRKKEQLRRRLLEAIAAGEVVDPMSFLGVARLGLSSVELPEVGALAAAFGTTTPVA